MNCKGNQLFLVSVCFLTFYNVILLDLYLKKAVSIMTDTAFVYFRMVNFPKKSSDLEIFVCHLPHS